MKLFDASEGSPTKKYVVMVALNFAAGRGAVEGAGVLVATVGVEVATLDVAILGREVTAGGYSCTSEKTITPATSAPISNPPSMYAFMGGQYHNIRHHA
jgi:hypothetical protein